MASAGAEHEDRINEWMKSFEELPEDRRDKLMRWFATQKVIIENTGLSEEAWFQYIQWAMDNPFDYAFILDFPDQPEVAGDSDQAERTDATRGARELVGGQTAMKAPESGKGITEKGKSERQLERELFERFMQNRKS